MSKFYFNNVYKRQRASREGIAMAAGCQVVHQVPLFKLAIKDLYRSLLVHASFVLFCFTLR